jgi:hypothetical protein
MDEGELFSRPTVPTVAAIPFATFESNREKAVFTNILQHISNSVAHQLEQFTSCVADYQETT